MSCSSCSPFRWAPVVAALLTAVLTLGAIGCGRKGDPLPPLREPDPAAEPASTAATTGEGGSEETDADEGDESEEELDEAGSDVGPDDGEPDDGEDDDGTPP